VQYRGVPLASGAVRAFREAGVNPPA
jgi:hypothetical protein